MGGQASDDAPLLRGPVSNGYENVVKVLLDAGAIIDTVPDPITVKYSTIQYRRS